MDVSNSDPFVGLSDEQVARLIDSAKILRTRIKRALFIKEVMTLLARQVTPGSERIRTISNGQLTLAIDDAMRRLGGRPKNAPYRTNVQARHSRRGCDTG
jgi:hypothetical protein